MAIDLVPVCIRFDLFDNSRVAMELGSLFGFPVRASTQHPDGPFATFDRDDPRFAQTTVRQLHDHLRPVRIAPGLGVLAARSAELWRTGAIATGSAGAQVLAEWLIGFLAQELVRAGSLDGAAELSAPGCLRSRAAGEWTLRLLPASR